MHVPTTIATFTPADWTELAQFGDVNGPSSYTVQHAHLQTILALKKVKKRYVYNKSISNDYKVTIEAWKGHRILRLRFLLSSVPPMYNVQLSRLKYGRIIYSSYSLPLLTTAYCILHSFWQTRDAHCRAGYCGRHCSDLKCLYSAPSHTYRYRCFALTSPGTRIALIMLSPTISICVRLWDQPTAARCGASATPALLSWCKAKHGVERRKTRAFRSRRIGAGKVPLDRARAPCRSRSPPENVLTLSRN